MSMIIATLLAAAAPCAGSTTRDVEKCFAADLDHADAELNRYFASAVARLTKEQARTALASLRASEQVWIAYRDAECAAIYERWKEGTIRGAVTLGCRIRITKARTMTIWRNWLTYADSTPPLLPTPSDERR